MSSSARPFSRKSLSRVSSTFGGLWLCWPPGARRNEAQRKQLYLERIVQPSLPDVAVEPRRLRNVLATFALGLVAWGVIGMLLAGVREHQQ